MPAGRPTKYKPEYCQQIIDFISAGGQVVYKYTQFEGETYKEPIGKTAAHLTAFARSIDVTMETLSEWCKVHPEFSEAYQKAKEIQLEHMVDGAVAGVLQAAPTIFALKNMHCWRDKQELVGEGGGALKVDLGEVLTNALVKAYGN